MNPNLLIWTTDWHVVSNDAEAAQVGSPTTPTEAQQVVAYINDTLDPLGCFDTGDNKDHYGAVATEDEHDNYITYVGNELRWLAVNAGDTNALYPNLPGNHDEYYDYTDTPPLGNDDWSTTYDVKFWTAPYHWTADWAAAQIRIIGIHSYIHHSQDGLGGFFHIDQGEIDWLEAELAALPTGWQAIVCSHAAANTAFGNEIRSEFGGTNLRAVLAANASRIACYLNGHRHANMNTNVLSGITHFNGGAVSYTEGNGNGGFMPITHDPVARTLSFDFRYARTPFARYSGYTPVVISLPAFRAARGRSGLTASTSSAARMLTGAPA